MLYTTFEFKEKFLDSLLLTKINMLYENVVNDCDVKYIALQKHVHTFYTLVHKTIHCVKFQNIY